MSDKDPRINEEQDDVLPRSNCCGDVAWAPLDGSSYYCNKCNQPCKPVPYSEASNSENFKENLELQIELENILTAFNAIYVMRDKSPAIYERLVESILAMFESHEK